jgi:hypothetical protein
MGLPKHVKKFVLEEIRSLDYYRREIEFRKRRIEELQQEMGAVILPDRPFEKEHVRGGKPADPAQLKVLYLQEEMEHHQERFRILSRKVKILTEALDILDPERCHVIRWASERERDRAPAWQIAERYCVSEKTIYRWQVEAVQKLAPLLVGVFGR